VISLWVVVFGIAMWCLVSY